MLETLIPRIPDDWTVWTFADSHGVVTGLRDALLEAGLIDPGLGWIAPPRTALIGCGDYIDRGRDSRRMVGLLRHLHQVAEQAGGRVLLARGNHEHLPLLLRAGRREFLDVWLRYDGGATLESYGCPPGAEADPAAALREWESRSGDLFAWMAGLPQAIRWRDVLFVHAGLPPWCAQRPRTGHRTAPLDPRRLVPRAVGVGRVRRLRAGRHPAGRLRSYADRDRSPAFFHAGRSICLDTNACGNAGMPSRAKAMISLLHLAGEVAFADARIVTVSTAGAPDRRRP